MSLKNIFYLFIFTIPLLRCDLKNNKVSSFKSNGKDSLFYYLDKSKDKSVGLKKRLDFIDKAFKKSINLPLDSLSLAIISYKSLLHYKQNQLDSTLFYDKVLLKTSHDINSDYYMAKANKNLAFYYKKKEDPNRSFYYFNESKNHYLKIRDSSQVGRRLMSMAQIQQNNGDYVGSKETLTEALQYLKQEKNTKYLASSYNDLATNHIKLLNPQDAVKYYKLAITSTQSKRDQLIYQNNLATVFIDTREYRKAIVLLKEIKSDSLLKNRSKQYARVIDNLAYAKWLKGDKDILPTLLEALYLRDKHNDKRGQIASGLHLGEYYLNSNKQLAKHYLKKVIQISKQLKSPKGELEALQFLMELNSNDNVIKDRYISLNDSLYKQELKAKTQFAKYKYDDKINKVAIATLTIEKKQNMLEILRHKNQKIIAALLAIISMLSGAFLFYYLKQKHKKNTLKEIYSTETRISRKVHDELANDVYNLINRIQNKPQTKQEFIIDELENVYKKARDISYENNSINLENKYYQLELKEMISAYQNNKISISTIGLHEEIWDNVNNRKKIVIERVLKEIMTNMKKHSKASNVVISFNLVNRNLHIEYVDDGIGINKIDNFKGNGLQNVETRIHFINGTFTFDQENKTGVKLKISIPV